MTARGLHTPAAPAALDMQQESAALLAHGFADPPAAGRHLRQLAEGTHARQLQPLLPELLRQMAEAADPDRALVRFERFLRASVEPARVLDSLREEPRGLEVLAAAFGGSAFLAETLIRHPAWFFELALTEPIRHRRSRVDIEAELRQAHSELGSNPTHEAELNLLRLAKRRELFHIGVRDLLRLATTEATLLALSDLAGSLIQEAYLRSEAAQRRRDSLPALPDTAILADSGFTVLGFGKLGGSELNFSSDVDLVYLYKSDRGRVRRARGAPLRADYAHHLARRVTAALTETTGEGTVYRVDLRLRPEGRSGPVAGSLGSFQDYYRSRGVTWERLALLKAWPVAGDRELGTLFLQRVRPFVYGRPFGPEAVRDVLRLKHALDRRVAERGESQRDVKLGIGGIREIELVAQALQLRHGRRLGALHVRGTLQALAALREARLLPEPEADVLRRAYLFLRDVENKLQLVADAQVHALPRSREELRFCARRLGYRDSAGASAADALERTHQAHTEAVHGVFLEVFARLQQTG